MVAIDLIEGVALFLGAVQNVDHLFLLEFCV